MKNILKFLEKYSINSFILLVIFVLTLFISYVINKSFVVNVLFSTADKVTLNDFMANYYKTQADWQMFWLTLLAFLTATIGIIVPFVLGQSYKEKIKEMECEFEKHINEVDYYRDVHKESIANLKRDIDEIKKQAKLSEEYTRKQARICDEYTKKTLARQLSKFKEDIQESMMEIKVEALLTEIKSLQKDFKKAQDLGKKDDEYRIINLLIEVLEKAISKYSANKRLVEKLKSYLEDAYFDRSLIYFYDKHDYKCAMSDLLKADKMYIDKHDVYEQTYSKLLLYTYIMLKDYKEADKVLDRNITLYPKDVNKYIDILNDEGSQKAHTLCQKIRSVVIS